MLFLLEILNFAVFETLLVSIPESIGLFVFGIGLVIVAVLIRSFLAREETKKRDEKGTKKA